MTMFDTHPPLVWSFDQDAPDTVPQGFEVLETHGQGHPAGWEIMADESAPSPAHFVAITQNENKGHTYNLLMEKEALLKDVVLSVKVRAMEGTEDQGGGPLWRARDENNYYLARWNPLENNFRVYRVREGKRTQLDSIETEVDEKAWHTLAIEHKGGRIRASLDGENVMVVRDDTFPEAGRVGFWVKADGKTAFDDLTAAEIKN